MGRTKKQGKTKSHKQAEKTQASKQAEELVSQVGGNTKQYEIDTYDDDTQTSEELRQIDQDEAGELLNPYSEDEPGAHACSDCWRLITPFSSFRNILE